MSQLGLETIAYAGAPFGGPPADLEMLVGLARASGFDWIGFDRESLAEQERRRGGLLALARRCELLAMPCRVVQSLVPTGDPDRDRRAFERLRRQVDALRPEVVPVILREGPTTQTQAWLHDRVAELGRQHPGLRFAVEFGDVFGIPTLQRAREFVAALDDPQVGLLVDAWHVLHSSASWNDFPTLAAEEIALVQLSDHGPLLGADLKHARYDREVPGHGSLPVVAFVRALHTVIGYRGLVSVEVISARVKAMPVPDSMALLHDSTRSVLAESTA